MAGQELGVDQLAVLRAYQETLLHPAGGNDIPVSQSFDGATTLKEDHVAHFSPGAATVHVWFLDRVFKTDVVEKGGATTSFPLPFPPQNT